MAHCRHRDGVDVTRLGEDRPMLEHPRKAGAVVVAKTKQVIVAELVDDDRQHQLRFPAGLQWRGEKGCRGAHYGKGDAGGV